MASEYAIYKGDTFLCLGTAKECAEFLGIQPKSIHWYMTPTYRKRIKQGSDYNNRITVIRLEDDVQK